MVPLFFAVKQPLFAYHLNILLNFIFARLEADDKSGAVTLILLLYKLDVTIKSYILFIIITFLIKIKLAINTYTGWNCINIYSFKDVFD